MHLFNNLKMAYLLLFNISVQAFAIFCGMAIHNTSVYEDVQKAMAKQGVAFEVIHKV